MVSPIKGPRRVPTSLSRIGLGLLAVILHAIPAIAEIAPLTHFRLRQQRIVSDGVLVARPHPVDKKILDILDLHKIRSIEDYARWLQKNIVYQSDASQDIWSDPQHTLATKRGDCEDFAFLNSAVLRVMGYEPHLLAMVQGKRAHAVCAFKKNGCYIWFDNNRIKNTTATSLQELARQITLFYQYSRLLELDLTTNTWRPLYQQT